MATSARSERLMPLSGELTQQQVSTPSGREQFTTPRQEVAVTVYQLVGEPTDLCSVVSGPIVATGTVTAVWGEKNVPPPGELGPGAGIQFVTLTEGGEARLLAGFKVRLIGVGTLFRRPTSCGCIRPASPRTGSAIQARGSSTSCLSWPSLLEGPTTPSTRRLVLVVELAAPGNSTPRRKPGRSHHASSRAAALGRVPKNVTPVTNCGASPNKNEAYGCFSRETDPGC